MRVNVLALSVVTFIVILCVITAVILLSVPRPGIFDLSPLYKPLSPAALNRNTGNFIKTKGGSIFFFHPKSITVLREAMASPGQKFRVDAMKLDLPKGLGLRHEYNVTSDGKALEIDSSICELTEIDRLELSPEWASVLDFCSKRIYIDKNPDNAKYVDQNGIGAHSVVRLDNGTFLITGGLSQARRPSKESEELSSHATIYDVTLDRVVAQFKLRTPRFRHLSILLPNDKVLLLGGCNLENQVEIVDPNSQTSEIVSTGLPKFARGTACIDKEGNCLILGGKSSSASSSSDVFRFFLTTNTCDKVANLQIARSYVPDRGVILDLNAVSVPEFGVLISGGCTKVDTDYFDVLRKDAELLAL